MNNIYIGTLFDDFLEEEGLRVDVEATARERIHRKMLEERTDLKTTEDQP